MSALSAALASFGRAHLPCLLCARESSHTGVLFPAEPMLWGAPAGKDRVFLYAVCPRCFDRADLTDLVEGRILDSLGGTEQ